MIRMYRFYIQQLLLIIIKIRIQPTGWFDLNLDNALFHIISDYFFDNIKLLQPVRLWRNRDACLFAHTNQGRATSPLPDNSAALCQQSPIASHHCSRKVPVQSHEVASSDIRISRVIAKRQNTTKTFECDNTKKSPCRFRVFKRDYLAQLSHGFAIQRLFLGEHDLSQYFKQLSWPWTAVLVQGYWVNLNRNSLL